MGEETEEVKLRLIQEKGSGNSLAELIAQMKEAVTWANRLDASLSGRGVSGSSRSLAQLRSEIQKIVPKGGVPVEGLAKSLGLDPVAFDKHIAGMSDKLGMWETRLKKFRSINKAAAAVVGFERQSSRSGGSLAAILKPTAAEVGPATAQASALTARVEGQIKLIIPASQFDVMVSGQIPVAGPAAGTGTSAAGGASASTAAKKAAAKSGGGGLTAAAGGELTRTLTKQGDALTETVVTAEKFGETLTETFDKVNNELTRSSRKTNSAAALSKNVAHQKKFVAESIKQAKALNGGDLLGLARIQENAASQLESILTPEIKGGLKSKKMDHIGQFIEAEADTLRKQAEGNRNKFSDQRKAAMEKDLQKQWTALDKENKAKEKTEKRAEDKLKKNYASDWEDLHGQNQEREANRNRTIRANFDRDQKMKKEAEAAAARAAKYSSPPVIPPPKIPVGQPSYMNRLTAGFQPGQFLLNVGKVSGWASAVTVYQKAVELAAYSTGRLIDVGAQTARLSQVFNGVGGSAKQLTDDILALAVVNGRTTAEAMESAVQWSRLGLNRFQVQEAVRVSLIASNVAEIDAATATKYLSSIMAAYSFSVGDLEGVLGQLNNTSNKFNVTNEDLLTGIARSASVARQAGLSFGELQGIIGATVGQTGQTGANIGNALKSVLVSLADPTIQKFLRQNFKIDFTTNTGEINSATQNLRQLWEVYQGLNNAERQNLARTVAGRTQASRFVAILDSYVQGQRLAIDGTLNLNSALVENQKITATLKSQVEGLKAAWDRLIVNRGTNASRLLSGNSPVDILTEYVRTYKNLINLPSPAVALMKYLPKTFQRATSGPKLIGIGLTMGLMRYFNHWVEGPEAAARDKLADAIKRTASESEGLSKKADLLRGYARVFQSQRPGERARDMTTISKVIGGPEGERFQFAVKNNRLAEARNILEDQAQQASERGLQANRESLKLREAAVAQIGKEMDNGNVSAERRLQLETELNEIAGQTKAIWQDINDEESGDVGGGKRRASVRQMQAETMMLLDVIQQANNQMSGDSFIGKMEGEMASLTTQAGILEQQIARLLQMNGGLEGDNLRIKLTEELEALRGRQDSLSSQRGVMSLLDDRSMAFRYQKSVNEFTGTGPDEAARLLDRQAQLQAEVNRLRQRPAGVGLEADGSTRPFNRLTDNAAVRLLQTENDLYQTKFQIQTRILKLKQDEKQIAADTLRDQQKALLFSSPFELLKRLAVSTIGPNPTPGQFFSMSPELRQMYDESRGGDAGAANRREQNRLRGMGLSLEEQQKIPRPTTPPELFKNLDLVTSGKELESRAKAAVELNSVADGARMAAKELMDLAAIVRNMALLNFPGSKNEPSMRRNPQADGYTGVDWSLPAGSY